MSENTPQEPFESKVKVSTLLRNFSIFAFVAFVAAGFDAFIILSGNGAGGFESAKATSQNMIMYVGIPALIVAIADLAAGIIGLQCNKDSSKAGLLLVVSIIGLVFGIAYLVGNFTLDAGSMSVKFAAAQVLLLFYLVYQAYSVKKGKAQ